MKRYLLKDIHELTSIKENIIQKISNIGQICICDYLNELDILGEDVLNVDIGFGTISMLVLDEEIRYSFIPNKVFEKAIIKSIEKKESPLIRKSEFNLEKKINATYKEIL